jgi:hypothetical protein
MNTWDEVRHIFDDRYSPPSAAEWRGWNGRVPTNREAERRARLRLRLEQVTSALQEWDAWEANQQLPPHLRRTLRQPRLPRDGLATLQQLIQEDLAQAEIGD